MGWGKQQKAVKKQPAKVQRHDGDRHPHGGHRPTIGSTIVNGKVWDGYGWKSPS